MEDALDEGKGKDNMIAMIEAKLVESATVPDLPGLERFDQKGLKKLFKQFEMKAAAGGPWNQFSQLQPDLDWHTPTCDENSWKHKDVLLQLGEGIAYVTLNRPDQSNCINDTVIEGLCDAVFVLHRRLDIRVVCFMANGPVWCGGEDPARIRRLLEGDVGTPMKDDGSVGNRISKKVPTPEVQKHLDKLVEDGKKAGAFTGQPKDYAEMKEALLWSTLTKLPSVTVAVVTGSVVGSGIGLVACMDLCISLKTALFSMPDLKDGLLPTPVMPHIVQKAGPSVTKRLLCSGEVMTAEDAKAAKLVQEVIEDDKGLTDWIWEISDAVTACGPNSVKAAKELVLGVGGQPIGEPVMFFTASLLAKVTVSEEAKVGMICLQQRKPKPWEEPPITPLFGENPHPERRVKA
mmetsp:Transcript_57444/g.136563  ORF Transcript_57444/g.136563 Transcript_57444/m.136563 type:complete len:404 (-) Transcript_57444:138-1349(-)